MKELQLPFAFRISELLPLARLLRTSYQRDQHDFTDLLPADYNAQFLARYDAALAAVEKTERSSQRSAERQKISQEIDQLLAELPTLLNRLEARVRRAADLTTPPKKFGIEAVRRDRNNDEHEGLAESLRTLLQNIKTNQQALHAKGQPDQENQKLQQLYDDLVKDGTLLGGSVSDQRLLTADNVKLYKALYQPMQGLMADGKSLYASTDKPRAKDYTLRQVLKRVRKEQGGGAGDAPAGDAPKQ